MTTYATLDRPAVPTTRPRWPERLVARLRATALDERLVRGENPRADRLLLARADRLTTRRNRHALADAWDQLSARARRAPTPFDPRVPIARPAVHSAADQVRQLGELLRGPRPVSAAGTVAATRLLTRATSPVYARTSGESEVALALEYVLAALRDA